MPGTTNKGCAWRCQGSNHHVRCVYHPQRKLDQHLQAMRDWVADCDWGEDAEDLAALTDAEVVVGIERVKGHQHEPSQKLLRAVQGPTAGAPPVPALLGDLLPGLPRDAQPQLHRLASPSRVSRPALGTGIATERS